MISIKIVHLNSNDNKNKEMVELYDVIFTGSASESNCMILKSTVDAFHKASDYKNLRHL